MADVQTYDDLPYTQFPVDVDTFEDMQDVSLDTYGWVKQYNEYFASGNIKSAQALLAAHPELQKCIFNALKINRMSQAIKAMERFYKEDITDVITNVAKNTVGINDDPTEEQAKVTTYSSEKIKSVLETIESEVDSNIKEMKSAFNSAFDLMVDLKTTVIETSAWTGTGPWTAVLSIDGVDELCSPIIAWYNTADDAATKKQQQKAWNMVDTCETGNGIITFTCKFKKPTVDIPIAIKGR